VAGSPSSSHLSPTQPTLGLSPPGQYSPSLHGAQTGLDEGVPYAVCTVPATHWLAVVQIDWFSPVVRLPAPQAAQTRLTMLEGTFVTNRPAGQVLQDVQVALFSILLNVPLGQNSQTWSETGVPAWTTYDPGEQAVKATQSPPAANVSPVHVGVQTPFGQSLVPMPPQPAKNESAARDTSICLVSMMSR
jgi:hypothetical protein